MPHYPPQAPYSQQVPQGNQTSATGGAPVPVYDQTHYDQNTNPPQVGEEQIQAVP